MNTEKNAAAYAAIDKYVRSYLSNRGLLDLEEDAYAKCHDFFETYKHLYRKNDRASLETFACRTANSCLKNILRDMARRKQREKIAAFRLANAHWEVLDQKRAAALVREALSQLPPEQAEILRCLADGEESLIAFAERKGISYRTIKRRTQAAKTAFIDIYQKLINEGY